MDNVANVFGYGAISNVHYYYYHLVLNIFVITASAFREFRHSMPQLIICFPLVAMLMFWLLDCRKMWLSENVKLHNIHWRCVFNLLKKFCQKHLLPAHLIVTHTRLPSKLLIFVPTCLQVRFITQHLTTKARHFKHTNPAGWMQLLLDKNRYWNRVTCIVLVAAFETHIRKHNCGLTPLTNINIVGALRQPEWHDYSKSVHPDIRKGLLVIVSTSALD